MSEIEYLKRRLIIVESALRHVMEALLLNMPPHSAYSINEIGNAWNRELDKLDAEKEQSHV